MKLLQGMLIGSAILLIVVVLYYSGLFSWFNRAWLVEHAYTIQLFIQKNFFMSILIYVSCFIAAILLFLPVTVLLTVSSGYFFGIAIGTVFSILGATVGGMIIFLITRYFLFSFIQPNFQRRYATLYRELHQHGAWYLLMMQIMPITPTILMNIGSAIGPISLRTFIWTTVIGLIPGTLVYTYLGSQLYTLSNVRATLSWPLVLLLTLLALLSVLPRLYTYYMQKK